MTCDYYLVYPELCFPENSLSLLVHLKISFFSRHTQLWRSIFSLLLYKSKWFLLTVRWFELHYCILSKSIDSKTRIEISQRGRTFGLDGVTAASQNATIRVLAAFNLFVDLLVSCGNQVPAKIRFVRSYLETNKFRIIPKLLGNLLVKYRKKEKLYSILFSSVRTWFSL